jgi:2-polyprenyl-3-methyl-5-hydroxy-6-metoxy-1,4-benzoquinol methylase
MFLRWLILKNQNWAKAKEKRMALTRFEQAVIGSRYWQKKREKEVRMLTSNIDCRNFKILNVGCGRSNLTDKVIKARKIVNLDLEYSPNVDTVASAARLPFGDGEFDVILFLRVLHHIPDFTQALNEALRCVKPKGFILISEPYDLAVKVMDLSGLTRHPKKVIKRRNIEEFVEENKLVITKKVNQLFWFYYGYQIKV